MRTLKFETLNMPHYIAERCTTRLPERVDIEAENSSVGINKYLLIFANHMGERIHEFAASALQGPSFMIKDNYIELGKYTIYIRSNKQKTGTIVTVCDRYGITLPNLGIQILKKEPVMA